MLKITQVNLMNDNGTQQVELMRLGDGTIYAVFTDWSRGAIKASKKFFPPKTLTVDFCSYVHERLEQSRGDKETMETLIQVHAWLA